MSSSVAGQELRRFATAVYVPRPRSIAQFAGDEITIPDGPYKGRRWNRQRQPYCGLLLDAIASNKWSRVVVIGDVQGGKTFAANILPCLYHLFELGQSVVYGVPVLDPMGRDKWEQDLLPAIEATRYRDLIPTRGGASRGGYSEEITFQNGASLKFLGYTGADHRRSGFTAPVAVLTEVDKGDTAGESSRETDPITQIERRGRAFLRTGEHRVYLECTVSVPRGRIWQEYCGDRIEDPEVDPEGIYSTEGRIALPCPHCREYSVLERDHLLGWSDAKSKAEAKQLGAFFCPACGERWSEREWIASNVAGVLVHRGQEIGRDGRVHGEPVPTDTLGFRWNTANNLFVSPGDAAVAEWSAARRHADDEGGRKDLSQFWWSLPWREAESDVAPLGYESFSAAVGTLSRGELPAGVQQFAVATDCGMFELTWVAMAGAEGRRYVIDYGVIPTGITRGGGTSDERRDAARVAVREALLGVTSRGEDTGRPSLAGLIAAGWGTATARVRPGLVLVDAGYLSPVVHAAAKQANGSGTLWLPFVGRGSGQMEDGRLASAYAQPTRKTATIRFLGDRYYAQRHQKYSHQYLIADADFWKSEVHDAFRTTAGLPGSVALFRDTSGRDHGTYRRHLTAEEQRPDSKGRLVWHTIRKANHYLDATYAALVALHRLGLRVEVENAEEQQGEQQQWWSNRSRRPA